MTEIFADGINSIAVSNGGARIELVQLRKTQVGEARMVPEPVANLLVPTAGLQQMAQQFAEALRHVQQQQAVRAEVTNVGRDRSAADEALSKL